MSHRLLKTQEWTAQMYKLTKDDRVVLYNKVFGTDEGKIVLENIMEICGVNTVSADLLNPNIALR
jgi:hypothetical protein